MAQDMVDTLMKGSWQCAEGGGEGDAYNFELQHL